MQQTITPYYAAITQSGNGLTASMTVVSGDTVYWSSDPNFTDTTLAEGHMAVGDPAQTFEGKEFYLLSDPGGQAGEAVVDIELSGGTQVQLGPQNPGTTLGTLTGKMAVYDYAGNLMGYAPLYDNIT